jgi:hypothetical protein
VRVGKLFRVNGNGYYCAGYGRINSKYKSIQLDKKNQGDPKRDPVMRGHFKN